MHYTNVSFSELSNLQRIEEGHKRDGTRLDKKIAGVLLESLITSSCEIPFRRFVIN